MEKCRQVRRLLLKKVAYWLFLRGGAYCSGVGHYVLLWLGCKILDPQYVTGGTGTLTPYTGVFCFAAGVLITTPVFNTFAMSHPAQGNKVTMKDYLKGDTRTHLIGMLGGFIWMSGMVVSFMGAGSANPAIAYALSNAAPVVAMIWGFFVGRSSKALQRGLYL